MLLIPLIMLKFVSRPELEKSSLSKEESIKFQPIRVNSLQIEGDPVDQQGFAEIILGPARKVKVLKVISKRYFQGITSKTSTVMSEFLMKSRGNTL